MDGSDPELPELSLRETSEGLDVVMFEMDCTHWKTSSVHYHGGMCNINSNTLRVGYFVRAERRIKTNYE